MPGKDIRFDGPGRYLVITKEEASPELFEMFKAVKSKTELTEDDIAHARLIVDIKDQSELLSFLNLLYDNHHTILKIERLSNRTIDQTHPK